MEQGIHIYDDRFRGLCHRRPDGPVVARARLTVTTGGLWWKRYAHTEGFAVVQAVYIPDAYGGDDYFRPVQFFDTKEEAIEFAEEMAVVIAKAEAQP